MLCYWNKYAAYEQLSIESPVCCCFIPTLYAHLKMLGAVNFTQKY